jgi:predicted nucleic acid-binding protein
MIVVCNTSPYTIQNQVSVAALRNDLDRGEAESIARERIECGFDSA